jgi:hypothetical protein
VSGRIRRNSCESRLSSTAINAAAMLSSAVSSGGIRRSTIAVSDSSSPSTRVRSAPRPSTPSVSQILRSISSCGCEVVDLRGALAHEDVEHVLDARQVLADRGRNRASSAARLGADSASAASTWLVLCAVTMSCRLKDCLHFGAAGPASRPGVRDVIEQVVEYRSTGGLAA